tara:strand:+ start:99 stop:443 length:345 start_codon:yes stop_codon:yes gene_type:complete
MINNMEDSDNTTSKLSISNKNLDCNEVSKLLLEMGVCSSIIENKSIVYNNNKYNIENGCMISINGLKSEHIESRVWNPLKSRFNLGCGHLEIYGKYIGCILNYIRPSSCGKNNC